jgi:NTE family protein
MDVIAVFGGGGSLGAFDCGVWSVLAPVLRARGARLVAVGGVSIGALNAACVARGGSDLRGGPARLEALWCEQLTTPSLPFDPLPHASAPRWNGLLTGLLLGNATLYRANPWHWNPLAGLDRRARPLMDREGLWRCIAANLDGLGVADAHMPLLCVPAVDVAEGTLAMFDNAQAPLTTAHLAAASALPLLFEPVEVEGRWYWDGDVTRESALPLMLERLRERGCLAPGGDGGNHRQPVHAARPSDGADNADAATPTLLLTVDHHPRRGARVPQAGVELAHRALDLLLGGKYALPPHAMHGITHRIEIERDALEHDDISGIFDFSPGRIDALIEQGRRHAERLCERDWTLPAREPGPAWHPAAARAEPSRRSSVLH